MGSQRDAADGAPQQEDPPDVTRLAASPYFSRTASLTLVVSMLSSCAVLGLVCILSSRDTEYPGKILRCSVGLLTDRGTVGLGAAFVHQEANQSAHDRVVGLAVKRRRVPLLGDEAHDEQGLQMVGEG